MSLSATDSIFLKISNFTQIASSALWWATCSLMASACIARVLYPQPNHTISLILARLSRQTYAFTAGSTHTIAKS